MTLMVSLEPADWLPPTSCRTFDEIQTFGPIPSASCGYRGPRNGVAYSATTVDAPWIPEDERPKREIGKLDNWHARWSDKRPRVLHAKQIGPWWSIVRYRISRSRRFTTDAAEFIFMIRTASFWKKNLLAKVMSDQSDHSSGIWCEFYNIACSSVENITNTLKTYRFLWNNEIP